MSELKKMILEDDLANITRSGKHYKPSFLEKDHPRRNVEKGSKLIGHNVKEEKEEEDRVLTKLKKTQALVMVWRLLMASHEHLQCTPRHFEWERNVYRNYIPFLTFFDGELPPEGATHTRPL